MAQLCIVEACTNSLTLVRSWVVLRRPWAAAGDSGQLCMLGHVLLAANLAAGKQSLHVS